MSMPVATLTAKGHIVIPAEIRARYGLVPGTQVEFVDDGEDIRLAIRRRATPTTVDAGYGMLKVPAKGVERRLADFDAAELIRRTP